MVTTLSMAKSTSLRIAVPSCHIWSPIRDSCISKGSTKLLDRTCIAFNIRQTSQYQAAEAVSNQQKSRDVVKSSTIITRNLPSKLTAAHTSNSVRATHGMINKKHRMEDWRQQKYALLAKFGEDGWKPRKRLSPDTLEGIRSLHASDPEQYSTQTLSQHFRVSPEAIRRILKSKWKPNEIETEARRARWERRGLRNWSEMAAQGIKAPSKWRAQAAEAEMQSQRQQRTRKDVWDDVVDSRPSSHLNTMFSKHLF